MERVIAIKRRIIFINRYFYPDHSATSQILSDLVFYLSAKNFNIEIISSRQKYDNPDAVLNKTDIINGVKVSRIWTTRFGRQNLLGRAIDYLSFYLSAIFYLLFKLTSDDVVVAKTDPPLISIIAALVAHFKGARLVNWIQDLFPEVAKCLGVRGLSLIYPLLLRVRNYSLNAAFMNVVIGEKMLQRLQSSGVDSAKIKVIHNWSIEDNITPLDSSKNPLREKWCLQDKFIVGYSGNIGRAHDFTTLIDAAKSLTNNQNIIFIIIGGGAQVEKIKKQVNDLGLNNVMFQPYQDKEVLQYSLTLPDLHVISLIPELEGLIVPSKFYGIAASGRPVLYIGNKDGEIPRIMKVHRCGETVEIGDIQSATKFIKKLQMDLDLVRTLGSSIRGIYDEKYHKHYAFESWVELLLSLDNSMKPLWESAAKEK